jgi:hypothetical protein
MLVMMNKEPWRQHFLQLGEIHIRMLWLVFSTVLHDYFLSAGTILGPSRGSIAVIDWSTNPCMENKPSRNRNRNRNRVKNQRNGGIEATGQNATQTGQNIIFYVSARNWVSFSAQSRGSLDVK